MNLILLHVLLMYLDVQLDLLFASAIKMSQIQLNQYISGYYWLKIYLPLLESQVTPYNDSNETAADKFMINFLDGNVWILWELTNDMSALN